MGRTKTQSLGQAIRAKAQRKIKANRNGPQGVWRGLGMMGLVGWSVSVPTLIGAAVGFWIDTRFPGTVSWTLTMLVLGLVFGCANAWHWVLRESAEMAEDDTDD